MIHYANFLAPRSDISNTEYLYEVELYPDTPPAGSLNARNIQTLDNELRSWAAQKARVHHGFMCHSAGLVHRGKSWMLMGRSGAGKTTLALKLAPYCDMVLSDEVCVVLPVEQGWKVWGTAFYGTGEQGITGPGSPLEALFFPHRAQIPGIVAITPNEALTLFLKSVSVPNKEKDATILDDAIQLLQSTNLYKTWFASDTSAKEVYHALVTTLSSQTGNPCPCIR